MTIINKDKKRAIIPFKTSKSRLLVIAFIMSCFQPSSANAANLFDLAVDFFNRVSPVYEEKKEFNPLDQIPEGGTLLLQPRSERIFFGEEIFAVKRNNEIYMDINDFINILEFPIDYDEETLTGSGWYLREDWDFSMNIREGVVQSRGNNIAVSANDIVEQDGFIFARQKAMENWFGLLFDIDVEQQILNIESPFPFPAIAKIKREDSFWGRRETERRIAKLPRLQQPRKNFDINSVDVSLGNRVQRNKLGRVTNQETANVSVQGEILKHNGYVFVNADSDENIRSIRGEIFKRSERPNLLGPLKARSYRLGDIQEVRLPLASSANSNFGFRFSNSTLDNTDFARTNIEGSLFPGWDVQLYRNGILIDSATIEQDGEYEFNDIQLFAGDNDFELFFFGPQGEIRSEQVAVPVSPALLSSQDGTYEISIALDDSQTYRDTEPSSEDADTPNITARYNKLIGDNHLGYLGFRSAELLGDRKYFLSAGATSTLGETLVDTNLSIDQEANASAQAILRRNLFGWSTSLRARYNTEDYQNRQSDINTVYEVALDAQRSINFLGFRSSFLFDSLFSKREDDSNQTSIRAAIANRLFDTNISNALRYESVSMPDDSQVRDDRLLHTFSLRRNFGKLFLNLTSNYELEPENQLQRVSAQMNYRFNNDFSTDLTLERRFSDELDTAQLNVNYIHDNFRLSPFIQYNSDEELLAGLNLNFALYDDPNSSWPGITSGTLRNRAALSAFVYHDKNSNRVFDGEDEPIRDAEVMSVQSARREVTDEDGRLLIFDLPTRRATDITISEGGLEDPFMIPTFEGNSIIPEPGRLYEMEFPVELTGEVDGTIYRYDIDTDRSVPVAFQDVMLVALDDPEQKPLTVKAERDGFYLITMVPPGDYMVLTEENKTYGNTPPQFVTIGPEGTIVGSIDLAVEKDMPYVPYEVAAKYTEELPLDYKNYSKMLRVKRAGASSLSELLFKAINKNTTDLFDGLVKVNRLEKDEGKYDYYVPVATADIENPIYIHRKCQALKERLAECLVIVNATIAVDPKTRMAGK